MAVQSKVKKWGNSLGIRLPKAVASQLQLADDSEVEIRIKGNKIVITPAAPEYTLKGLVEKVSRKNIHEEIAAGPLAGQEIW